MRERYADRAVLHIRREAFDALLSCIVDLRIGVTGDRHRHFGRLIDGQGAVGGGDIIVGNGIVAVFDFDVRCGDVERSGIRARIGLALRAVISYVDIVGDCIAGTQAGDGVFVAIRVRDGLCGSVVGIGRRIGCNRQRDLIVDRDDIGILVLDDGDRLRRRKAAELRAAELGVEAGRRRRGKGIANLHFAGFVIGHLDGSAIEIVVDGIAGFVQIEVELHILDRIDHVLRDGQDGGIRIDQLVGAIHGVGRGIVAVGEDGIAHVLDEGHIRRSRPLLIFRRIAVPVIELDHDRDGLIGQIFEGDDVGRRVGGNRQALHGNRGIILHAVVGEGSGRNLGHALHFLTDRLRFGSLKCRVRILDDILHRIAGGCTH